MDVEMIIYNALLMDPYIEEQASSRIKFYKYPESESLEEPFIIIDPIDIPKPADLADDTWLTYDCLYQIEVWTKDRSITKTLGEKVHQVLWKLGFKQNGGLSEYDSGIFRDARRFRGKLYREDFDTIAVSLNKKE
ncbi:hypothetical protein [Niallia taxi]|uniref:hypothetical protein n=1 Tax=Niallia taxi TaxID=2499688 RepID=UPI0015F414D3|nr:hypothetical protein [Niallia taxi]